MKIIFLALILIAFLLKSCTSQSLESISDKQEMDSSNLSPYAGNCIMEVPFIFDPKTENIPDDYLDNLETFVQYHDLRLCDDSQLNLYYRKNLPDFVGKEKLNYIYSGEEDATCIGVFQLNETNNLLLFAHLKQSDGYSSVTLELQWFDNLWNFKDHLIAGVYLIGETSILRSFRIDENYTITINMTASQADFETNEVFSETESFEFGCSIDSGKFVQK